MSLIRQVYYYNRVKYSSAQIVSTRSIYYFQIDDTSIKNYRKIWIKFDMMIFKLCIYIYLYTSLLKIYVAKLIISGMDNRGATKH